MAEPAVKTEPAAAVKVEQPVVKQENGTANGADAAKGAGMPKLDGDMFFRRLQNLYRLWKVSGVERARPLGSKTCGSPIV